MTTTTTTTTTIVPETAAPRVDPEAALALLELAHRQVERFLDESDVPLGNLAWHLGSALAVPGGRVDAATVERARWFVWVGHRLDLTDAFHRLNPGFGAVHHGCWPSVVGDRARQAAAQRRELELCMGERFARLLVPLVPVEGGRADR